MDEIHNISEGSIVEVTDVETGANEIFDKLQVGVRYEVRSIKDKVRSSRVIVKLSPVDGQDIPSYKSIIAATYESWPNGCSAGLRFDADGHITHFGDKYFDVKEV
jgi:CRISPR/Cas system-associated protein Cas5 (RAMP superfamily)